MSSSSGDPGQGQTNHVSQEMSDTKRIKHRHAFLFHVSWGGLCDELKERLPGRLGGEPRNCEKCMYVNYQTTCTASILLDVNCLEGEAF